MKLLCTVALLLMISASAFAGGEINGGNEGNGGTKRSIECIGGGESN